MIDSLVRNRSIYLEVALRNLRRLVAAEASITQSEELSHRDPARFDQHSAREIHAHVVAYDAMENLLTSLTFLSESGMNDRAMEIKDQVLDRSFRAKCKARRRAIKVGPRPLHDRRRRCG
jgi:hypothetical protein